MRIAFFVNDYEREYAGYTTTVLAHQAAMRGHEVFYLTPQDFMLRPDDSLAAHGRMLPKKKWKDREEFFKFLKSGECKTEPIDVASLDILMLRSDPSHRCGNAVGGGGGDPVRARGGEARDHRPQRPRQPRPRHQQALFPELPARGSGRNADHQA